MEEKYCVKVGKYYVTDGFLGESSEEKMLDDINRCVMVELGVSSTYGVVTMSYVHAQKVKYLLEKSGFEKVTTEPAAEGAGRV